MRILLDTNIIMDALQERKPFDIEAKEILINAQNGEFDCWFTANSAADIFYLYSKARNTQSAKAALDFLFSNFRVISITHDDCKKALRLSINDFEDALVVVCAEKENIDFIITRDIEFLQASSSVEIVSPKKFISKYIDS